MNLRGGIVAASMMGRIAEGGGGPTAGWVVAWQGVGGQNAISGFSDKTFRIRLPASALNNAYGEKVRLTFKAGGDAMTISDCFVGIAASSGDPYDFEATATRITFNGGSNGSGSITASATILSDEVDFVVEEETDYIVSFHNSAGSQIFFQFPSLQDGAVGWYKAGNDASTVDATNYGNSEVYFAVFGLVEFEVYGFLDGDPAVPAIPKDPFGSYVIFMFTADGADRESDAALAPFGDYIFGLDLSTAVDDDSDVLKNTGTLERGYIQWDSAHDTAFNVLGSDWTIEGWITWPNNTATYEVFSYRGNEAFAVRRSLKLHIASGFYKMYVNGDTTADFEITSDTQITANARQHVAACRVGGTVYLFLDGDLVASGSFSGDVRSPSSVDVRNAIDLGAQNTLGDDWRWTKGIGRYHADFTPQEHLLHPATSFTSPDDHTYWRIKVTQNNGSGFTSIGSALRMYASTDGSGDNLVSSLGGSITGSAAGVFGNVLANLLDGNDGTQWAVSETGNDYVTFHFPHPVNINSVTMKLSTAGGQNGLMPMDFAVLYSDDGSTFTQKWSESGEDWTSGSTERVYAP